MRTIEQRLQSLERRVSTLSIASVALLPTVAEVSVSIAETTQSIEAKRYAVGVTEEIVRLLSTPLGSRVMNPTYGSELYKLRDRELTGVWLLMAIKYTFVAINRHIKRVRCRKVLFEQQGDGRVKMKLELERR